MLKELQILSEALWESVKSDLKFFSPIQSFSRKLAEYNFSDLTHESTSELALYGRKIEEFFREYRPTGGAIYMPPQEASGNDDTARRIYEITHNLSSMNQEELNQLTKTIKPMTQKKSKGEGLVFLGHGRSQLWARVKIFLEEELNLKTLSFESESRTSESIVNILDDFLNKTSYAILVMTAEDEMSQGSFRARQNVIHEAGLFQGRLGFDKVIILKQSGTEEFSNVAGLQYIQFTENNIEQTFYELGRKMKKLGLTNTEG